VAEASPFLASVTKRFLAALVDGGPLMLFLIFSLSLVDYVSGSVAATVATVVAVYIAYHAAFNFLWDGETPGRRTLNIRLVNARGADHLTLAKSILRPVVRALWVGLFIWIAIATLTQWLTVMPFVIDLFLVSALPWRQSTADFICGTVVVNSPTLHPHRAPAGPMYSATDAEFGNAPRRIK
jgi:uncharacterized RDD family membrane protein YckC